MNWYLNSLNVFSRSYFWSFGKFLGKLLWQNQQECFDKNMLKLWTVSERSVSSCFHRFVLSWCIICIKHQVRWEPCQSSKIYVTSKHRCFTGSWMPLGYFYIFRFTEPSKPVDQICFFCDFFERSFMLFVFACIVCKWCNSFWSRDRSSKINLVMVNFNV